MVKDLGNGESYGAVFEVLENKRFGKRAVLKSFVRDKTGAVNNWLRANTREKVESGFMPAGGDPRLPNNVKDAKADPPDFSDLSIAVRNDKTLRLLQAEGF